MSCDVKYISNRSLLTQLVIANGQACKASTCNTTITQNGNTITIACVYIEFKVGAEGAPLTAGDKVLNIMDTGIIDNSVHVYNPSRLPRYDTTQQYVVPSTPTSTSVTLTFGFAVADEDLFMIDYMKVI